MKNNIPRRTFYNWCDAQEKLMQEKDRLMTLQEMELKHIGLSKQANPAMAIFILKTDHGKIETEKIQHEGKGGEPISIIFTDSETYRRAEANQHK